MTSAGVAELDDEVTVGQLLDPRRWIALAIIAAAQLMVVLDATVVNIALPHAQVALAITDAQRSWVVTAYTLTFGGLLLLGGRIADYWGRKRTFLVGIIGFALASALGGAAQDGAMLFAARALQGAFGALLAPAALALLTVLFIEPRERARAFGVYGAIIGGGAALGLILGGVLTEYLTWRWCLLINVPIAVVAGLAALIWLRESKAHGKKRYDVPGALLITVGLAGLVYGFTQAANPNYGWASVNTWPYLAGSLALIAAFVVVELNTSQPLLPMRVLLERTRGGSYTASLLAGAGVIGASLFMTFYFQQVLHYRPVHAGLAALPVTGGIFLAFPLATSLLPRLGAKPIMAAGSFVAAAGLLLFTRIGLTDAYWTTSFPAAVVLGLGLGLIFVPLGNVALSGVSHQDAGAASAVVNASQQVGASLGTAALSAVALQAANAYVNANTPAGMTAEAIQAAAQQAGSQAAAQVMAQAAPTTPDALALAQQAAQAAASEAANQVIARAQDAALAFQNQVLVHSYQVAFGWAAAFLAVAGAVVLLMVKGGKQTAVKGAPIHFG